MREAAADGRARNSLARAVDLKGIGEARLDALAGAPWSRADRMFIENVLDVLRSAE